ncbi:FAD-dependent oxidoreductase [Sandaracinus amylolyticus]|uniref:FAD-dependent oxidoreductase n=1 Tax=Sandaracinus amylolyticus TaxID=927083 RepID=UPI001F216E9C|nr:FAD-dependent oxidoreductase [Sandaracinus amylolyticus]UJR79361.1 FAD-dependent oxidoreductase [Sandaracinus amylolyticus]
MTTRGPGAERAHVVIVGGGLAGCAAATVLAERGVRVTVIEKERYLGGRVGAWEDQLADGTRFEMERGFHAFFRQYYSVRALLRRIDPTLSCLRPLEDYPLLGPRGWSESFSGLPRRVPLNLLALVWRTPSLRLRDLPRIDVRPATEMVAFDPSATYTKWDHVTAREYLDSLGFPTRARQMLFDVFAHSFFNPEHEYSAAELLAMFHFYFLGNPEGLVFDVLREPFSTALWKPLRAYLEARGVRFVMESEVSRVVRRGARLTVEHSSGSEEGDALVLAVTVPALRALIDASPSLREEANGSSARVDAWKRDVASLEVTLPFVVWRLWIDRPLRADRAPFAGTTGLGILDNVSIYEKLEGESAAWARRTGGSIVELHAYAVDEWMDEAEIRRGLMDGLYEIYPEARDVKVLDERYLVRRDCPSFAPGSHATRPGVETPVPGLWLAGDFVKLPFPSALMERAVASGFRAASGIAASLGVAEEPIRTVPPRGVLAPWMTRSA